VDTKPTDLLVRMLGACELRARVVAANIANSNTPGYTRQYVRFEELLGQALADGRKVDEILPQLLPDQEAPARPDGNNVSLELEFNAMRENRLMYEAYSSMLSSHFALLSSALNDR